MTHSPVIESARGSDRADVVALLDGYGLPLDGLDAHWATAFVARHEGRLVGCAALEIYADGALLRSVAVAAARRGSGLGQALTDEAIRRASALGLPALYLLTTTAEAFFLRRGFAIIERSDVPRSVQASVEFTTACPASAVAMRRRL